MCVSDTDSFFLKRDTVFIFLVVVQYVNQRFSDLPNLAK